MKKIAGKEKKVKIEFMSHNGDFSLNIVGEKMNDCKETFETLFEQVKGFERKKDRGNMFR